MQKERAPKREIFGWAMFDFANSSYTTVIVTVVYAIVFPQIIVGDAPEYRMGNLLWSIGLSLSYVIVVATAPILGAIMDFSASKKKFLFASYLFTILLTAALFFVRPGDVWLGVTLLVLSNYGFAAGESFAGAFLPDLGPPEDLGKISGFAWGIGYIGGLISTALVLEIVKPGGGLTNPDNPSLPFIGPVTAAFFLLAGIPTFLLLKERGTAQTLPAGETMFKIGFHRLFATLKEIGDFRDLTMFLASLFFSQAGLYVVISFAFIYGAQVIHWSAGAMAMMFIITQFTAAGGAILFGLLQDRIGSIRTYMMTLVLWIVAVALIYGTNDLTAWINETFAKDYKAESVFLFIGCLAGLGLGATQSAGRAIVGIFSPESKSGEFFGFWGQSSKLSAIVGVLGTGLLQNMIGLQKAILFTVVLFILGMIVSFYVNEARGRKMAAEHEGE
ncbi:MAG: MFS transporter [Spirochaetae bacterium HGW-Spirochaetae-10]|nr:MAG: MFS transporter [Spirochaetae bacterium HGW-Spirochaetae-10]